MTRRSATFDIARHRPAAEAAGYAADARRAEARRVPHPDHGDPAAARFARDASPAPPHRAGQARELLSEGGVRTPSSPSPPVRSPSFRGASETSEPGIHNHNREYGFRACAKWRIPE